MRDAVRDLLTTPFRLDSVDEVAAPAGAEGSWHRYVIRQGENTITGIRCGSRAELDPVLRSMVDRLNERLGKQQLK